MMAEKIADLAEDCAGGNTNPPRKSVGRKRKVAQIAEIAEGPGVPTVKKEKPPNFAIAFHWCLTWNNYRKNWKDFFLDRKLLIVKCCVYEEICPTTGTPHLQGWIRLDKRNFAQTYLMMPEQISWRAMSRDATERQNITYCSKEKGKNHLIWGIPVPYTIDAPKKPWMEELQAILREVPDHRTIYWIWESTGNSGKTLFTKMMYLEMTGVIIINGKGHDIRHAVADYVTKQGVTPKIVLMDIPRVNKEYISYEALENVKNMCFYSGKYEGSTVCGENPHVMVFSNEPPEREKFSDDRWRVGRLKDDKVFWN